MLAYNVILWSSNPSQTFWWSNPEFINQTIYAKQSELFSDTMLFYDHQILMRRLDDRIMNSSTELSTSNHQNYFSDLYLSWVLVTKNHSNYSFKKNKKHKLWPLSLLSLSLSLPNSPPQPTGPVSLSLKPKATKREEPLSLSLSLNPSFSDSSNTEVLFWWVHLTFPFNVSLSISLQVYLFFLHLGLSLSLWICKDSTLIHLSFIKIHFLFTSITFIFLLMVKICTFTQFHSYFTLFSLFLAQPFIIVTIWILLINSYS